jgi:transposase
MYNSTKLVSFVVFEQLLQQLPAVRQRKMGRKRIPKRALVNGILQVLVNGVSWCKMAWCGCSYVSCFRYFQEVQRRGKLKLIFRLLAHQNTNLTIGSIDTTTVPSFEFERGGGWNGKDRVFGTKISLFADRRGQPGDVMIDKGNIHDKTFVEQHMKNTVGMRKKTLNLDMHYMSAALRRTLRNKGIWVNMNVRTQDYQRKRGPKFRFDKHIYTLRFLIERLNGWIKNFKRVRLRRDYHVSSFKGFVYLALIIILLRRN